MVRSPCGAVHLPVAHGYEDRPVRDLAECVAWRSPQPRLKRPFAASQRISRPRVLRLTKCPPRPRGVLAPRDGFGKLLRNSRASICAPEMRPHQCRRPLATPTAKLLQETVMPQAAPPRSQQSYRHEAFMWRDADDYASVLAPFVQDGLAAGEAVMVAVVRRHATWLRESLGTQARKVKFVDMAKLGQNPARIILAWQKFVDQHSGY